MVGEGAWRPPTIRSIWIAGSDVVPPVSRMERHIDSYDTGSMQFGGEHGVREESPEEGGLDGEARPNAASAGTVESNDGRRGAQRQPLQISGRLACIRCTLPFIHPPKPLQLVVLLTTDIYTNNPLRSFHLNINTDTTTSIMAVRASFENSNEIGVFSTLT